MPVEQGPLHRELAVPHLGVLTEIWEGSPREGSWCPEAREKCPERPLPDIP